MPSITTVAPAEQSIRGYRAVRYGPGESVAVGAPVVGLIAGRPHARQGDFILTHSTGLYGTLIRFGEGLRYWGTDAQFAHWSHAAIFVDDDGTIIEALGGGVQKRNISVYRDTEYVVVYLPESTCRPDRQHAGDFAEFCLSDKYGWLTIVSIGLSLLTGGKFGFGIDGQQICSALVARSIERIGEIFKESEPWHIMPADLAKHFDVRLTGERGRPPERSEGVVAASRPGRR
jgi:uncharacterized protein YycO